MSDEYAPTKDEVRAAFGRITHAEHDRTWDSGVAEFDRWLIAHDTRVARLQAERDAQIAFGYAGGPDSTAFEIVDEIRAQFNPSTTPKPNAKGAK